MLQRTTAPSAEQHERASLPKFKLRKHRMREPAIDRRALDRDKLLFSELLIGFHNDETGRCNPRQDKIAEALDWPMRTVQRAFASIKRRGWIEVDYCRGPNAITFPGLEGPPLVTPS